jgi:Zn-dependent protease
LHIVHPGVPLTRVAEVRRCTNLRETHFSLEYERVTPYF